MMFYVHYPTPLLKVSKFQKQIFLFSFAAKMNENNLLIYALASKMGRIKKIGEVYYITVSLHYHGVFTITKAFIFLSTLKI